MGYPGKIAKQFIKPGSKSKDHKGARTMKDIDKIVKSAIASILGLAASTTLVNTAYSAPTEQTEKCYGIVRTAMNDCQTATQSCAGSATKDRQPDAFIFLPKGTCNKIVGGRLSPKTGDKVK